MRIVDQVFHDNECLAVTEGLECNCGATFEVLRRKGATFDEEGNAYLTYGDGKVAVYSHGTWIVPE